MCVCVCVCFVSIVVDVVAVVVEAGDAPDPRSSRWPSFFLNSPPKKTVRFQGFV